MATGWIATDNPFWTYFTSTSSGAVKQIVEWLRGYETEAFLEESEFAKELSKGEEVDTFKPSWYTRRGFPESLTAQVSASSSPTGTIVFSGNFDPINGALTTSLLQQCVYQGLQLQKEDSSGNIHQVIITGDPTALTTGQFTLNVKSQDGANLVADSGPITYKLIGTPWADNRGFNQPVSLPRIQENTYTRIFVRMVQILESDKRKSMRLAKDPLQVKVEDVLRDMALEKARVLINEYPTPDPNNPGQYLSGYDISNPTMAGLNFWLSYTQTQSANPNIFVNANYTEPTAQALKNIIHNLKVQELAPLSRAGYQIWGHPDTMQYCELMDVQFRHGSMENKIVRGYHNRALHSDGIEVTFHADRNMPVSRMYVVPMNLVKYGPWAGGELMKKQVYTDDFSEKWMMREVLWGLMPESPRWLGCLYNIKPFGV